MYSITCSDIQIHRSRSDLLYGKYADILFYKVYAPNTYCIFINYRAHFRQAILSKSAYVYSLCIQQFRIETLAPTLTHIFGPYHSTFFSFFFFF